MAVFIPPSIRDKSIRDTLYALSREIGQGDGDGDGVEVTVRADEPTSETPGQVGGIIYAENSQSIWVFQGTSWVRASGGQNGDTPEAFYSTNARDSEPTTLPPSSEWVSAAERDNDTTYNWVIWGFGRATGGSSTIYSIDTDGSAGSAEVTTTGLREEGTITIPADTTIPVGGAGSVESFDLTISGMTATDTGMTSRTQLSSGASIRPTIDDGIGTVRLAEIGDGFTAVISSTRANGNFITGPTASTTGNQDLDLFIGFNLSNPNINLTIPFFRAPNTEYTAQDFVNHIQPLISDSFSGLNYRPGQNSMARLSAVRDVNGDIELDL